MKHLLKRNKRPAEAPQPFKLTGNCEVMEHSGDGRPAGLCSFALYDNTCPRHGMIEDYPNLDDREVDPGHRRFRSPELKAFLHDKK